MTDHRILARRSSLVVGAIGPVLLVVWTGTEPLADDVVACLPPLLREVRASRRGLIVAIHPSMPLPSEPVRRVIQDEVRKLDPHVVCGATVIERSGFSGAAARAVASTMQLLTRTSHPEKIVSSGTDAARFVASELAKDGSPPFPVETIVRAYDALTRDAWSQRGG